MKPNRFNGLNTPRCKRFVLLTQVSRYSSKTSTRRIFISDKKLITKTTDLLPNRKFYNFLENQFCNQFQKRLLNDIEIENLTNDFLKSADAKILLKAIEITKTLDSKITIVTEETSSNNDHKLFKKIPSICKELNIECIGLPKLIEKFNADISILVKNTSD